MSGIDRFEDLDAWKLCKKLCSEVYAVTSVGQFARDFELKDQFRRAAISAVANIAEGFGRAGNPEFLQFLSIARGSANEVHALIYVAVDLELINGNKGQSLLSLADRSVACITALMISIQKSNTRGPKYDS